MATDTVQKLPEAFKRKWITALRSGKYIKGKEKLETKTPEGVKYCCLGLAGKILGCKNMVGKGSFIYGNKIIGLENVPIVLRSDVINNESSNTLIKMNDNLNYSFNRIAGWIEKNL